MRVAGISNGMQNPVRTSTGRVAFAQPPATSLNPYGIKTDEVGGVHHEIRKSQQPLVSHDSTRPATSYWSAPKFTTIRPAYRKEV